MLLAEQLARESRLALRRLRAAPGATVFAILTLALGMGVSVATYSVVYSALWRPLGVPNEDRLVFLGRTSSLQPGSTTITWADYEGLVREQRGFPATAAWTSFGTVLAGLGTAELVTGEAVTGSYFGMLGVPAARGRLLGPDDDRADAALVVVLSHSTWRDQFGSDPDIVGKTVKLAGNPFGVVGVTPAGFRGLNADGHAMRAVWVSAGAVRVNENLARHFDTRRGWRSFRVAARLGADQTPAAAAEEFAAVGRRLDSVAPLPPLKIAGAPEQPALRSWTSALMTDDQSVNEADAAGRIIVALPALVLLIACTNIANLVLSRGVSRRHEFGVRRALGASRWRLIREQMLEQAVVVLIGGAAAIGFAHVIVRTAARVTQENLSPFLRGAQFDWSLDSGVLTSTGVAVLLSIVVAGLVPALHLTRDSLRTVLDQGGGTSTPKWRGRGNLVALQVGVSVGLFLIAVVFVRGLLDDKGLRRMRDAAAPGLDRIAVAQIPFDIQRDEAAARAAGERILADLRARSDVEASAITSRLPFGRESSFLNAEVILPERLSAPASAARRDEWTAVRVIAVTPDIFTALGAPIRSGRAFDDADSGPESTAVVVNEALARKLFGATDVAGRQMSMRLIDQSGRRTSEVVVVGMSGVNGRPDREEETVYVPYARQYVPSVALIARGREGQPAPTDAVRDAIKRADPELAASYVTRGDLLATGPVAFVGYIAAVLGSLAFLALGLAMAGLYGVLSHVMARRSREMGIRMALGAGPRRIARLVMRDGFRPIVEGLLIGLATATIMRVFLRTTLSATEIAPIDPLACVLAAGVVIGAGLLACYAPARRASSVDPNVALRNL